MIKRETFVIFGQQVGRKPEIPIKISMFGVEMPEVWENNSCSDYKPVRKASEVIAQGNAAENAGLRVGNDSGWVCGCWPRPRLFREDVLIGARDQWPEKNRISFFRAQVGGQKAGAVNAGIVTPDF